MPDALAGLPQMLQSILPILGVGETIAGVTGNIMNERTASQQQGVLKADEKVLNSPTLFNQQVAANTAPLNTGLVQDVTNTVDANAGATGTAQAPGIVSTELAQAIAPYIQQNQNTAIQTVLSRLTGSQSDAGSILSSLHNTNLSPLLAMLLRLNNPSNSTPGVSAPFQWQGPPVSGAGYNDPTVGDTNFNLPDGIFDNPAPVAV